MIAHIRGRLLEHRAETIVVEVGDPRYGGLGYEVTIVDSVLEALPAIGGEVAIVVYTEMRDSSITLFGFSSSAEREVFLLLRKVNGIGPRTAINIVSALGTNKIYQCIGCEDVASFKQVPGVGKRTAERIIVELREHVNSLLGNRAQGEGSTLIRKKELGEFSKPNDATINGQDIPGPEKDALLALTRLGFSKDQAEKAIASATAELASHGLQSQGIPSSNENKKLGAKKSSKHSEADLASEILRIALANIPIKG